MSLGLPGFAPAVPTVHLATRHLNHLCQPPAENGAERCGTVHCTYIRSSRQQSWQCSIALTTHSTMHSSTCSQIIAQHTTSSTMSGIGSGTGFNDVKIPLTVD
eukprot:14224-Heterococcus_DN1.PRE.1